MEKVKIRIGSRDSVLAVKQTQLVIGAIARSCPELDVELVTMKTAGDLNQSPFDEIDQNTFGAKGLFVNELERALLAGRIDFAVHSLKDMPAKSARPDYHLPILAFFKRGDPRDALVLPLGRTAEGGGIGCSSARRRVQLKELIPDSEVRPIRGNVLTRLKKLDEDRGYSSLVLAAAGLTRLGLESRIHRVFTPDEIIPAAGQAILALQGQALQGRALQGRALQGQALQGCGGNYDVLDFFNFFDFFDYVNDADSEDCAKCEMAFAERLGGGCTLPVAAYAEAHGTELGLVGLYADEDLGIYRKGRISGDRKDAVKLGETLAERFRFFV